MSGRRLLASVVALGVSASFSSARPAPPGYGHEFITITHAGNRGAIESERVFGSSFAGFPNLGGVSYEYRIARTEITAAQWLPFVEAFTTHWDAMGGYRGDSYFCSEIIRPTSTNPNAPPGWSLPPLDANRAVTMGVRMAAYYCNWLHNGRPLGSWANPVPWSAFASGAYDASTFTQNPDLTFNDQITRSEGALYWIPSLDEWTKAAHYDPNRYGLGQEGYWTSQGGQNEPLTSGLPGQGQTSAGNNFPQGFDPRSIPVGSYPDVMSPWGLLDTSGGVNEWTEAPTYDIPGGIPGFFRGRIVRGSYAGIGGNYTEHDLIDSWSSGSVGSGRSGFRIASAIPGPGSGLVLGLCVLVGGARRRRGAAIVGAVCATSVSVASPALSSGPNGHTFSTITHAGNAPATGVNPTNLVPYSMGAVSYEYRIGTTEVTYGQWFNFVRAAAPFMPPNEQNGIAFTSNGIVRIGGTYVMTSPANEATQASWRNIARYCNWLHNGARPAGVATAADFATGAYDISTFGQLPGGALTDQARRSEGALYWIPSVDEWTKAVYFDPNRFGENQPGYWLHPGGQDTQLISGPPSQGGQTSAGTLFMGNNAPRAVGSYVNVSAPWGLFDASGSESEWFEDLNPSGGARLRKLSDFRSAGNDALYWTPAWDIFSTNGVRIAALIPSPGGTAVVLLGWGLMERRRRG